MAARRAVDAARVQVHQRTGQQRGQHGNRQQGQRAQGEDPLRVGLAPVRVAPRRPDQQRYHHAGEDAAEHQIVDGVRQRVGVVVGVAERPDANRVHQDERAQEAGGPGGQGADRHAGAGPDQAGALGRGRPWGSGMPGARPAGRSRRSGGTWRPGRRGREGGLRAKRLDGGGPGWIRRGVVAGPGDPAPSVRGAGLAGGRRAVRPGRRGRPLERERQRRLGRARAAARHRALDRRQRIGGGVPAPARGFAVVRSRLVRPRRLLAAGVVPPGVRCRRPSVVHRPGHPVPPSGVALRWCQSRRYPLGPPLR